jgi:hypothetical protein
MCCDVAMNAIWPLMGLEVVTPTLRLMYITDDLATRLALLAAAGVHDPATMPFSTPWTDAPSPELERNTLRFYWRNRAETTVDHWDLNLAGVVDDIVVGMCSITADASRSGGARRPAHGSVAATRDKVSAQRCVRRPFT